MRDTKTTDYKITDPRALFSRNPNCNTAKHRETRAKFVQYTQSQIRLSDYGKIDCLRLDGRQLRRESGRDIRMDEIAGFEPPAVPRSG